MQQKTALVTGAAAGIGAAIANQLALDGYIVIASDIDGDALKKMTDRYVNLPTTVVPLTMDISNQESIDSGFAFIQQHFGRCDVLINNAGFASATSLQTCSLADWNRTMTVNVTSMLLCSQKATELMKQHRWGRIINISSVSGMIASHDRLAYGTSKAAVIGLTKQIAIELAGMGITANALAPGAIETTLTKIFHDADTRERFVQRIPAARYGEIEEVAAVASFLASDQSRYITGQVIAVDGGFVSAGILKPNVA